MNENAVVSTRTNSQAFGYFENIRAVKLDIVEKYSKIGINEVSIIQEYYYLNKAR